MAQLIQMRQRIKAIQTIKKITHAMRLISMSTHSRLRTKAPQIEQYQKEVALMFNKIQYAAPAWKNKIIHPETTDHQLIIIAGSQKGLCGNFNSHLFKEFKAQYPVNKLQNADIISVGKHAINFINKYAPKKGITSFDNVSSSQLNRIATSIVETIVNTKKTYSNVIIISNKLKSFFIQKPNIETLIPFNNELAQLSSSVSLPNEPYIWEQPPHEILDELALQFLTSKIYYLLFESILAEQAARFISMDNATRNAKNLLEETQLQYNKLRQAKITRELTELSASFQSS